MKLKWEHQSLDDRYDIFEYLYEFNALAAEKTDSTIVNRAMLLLEHPFMGIEREDRRGRYLIIPEISMLLSYEFDGDLIRIHRVIHTKQMFPEKS
ncbi:type II toxin-antitoxin system RelE/ParE family toxin [Vibrio sp. DW001]|uniref:type II toxin-antitoxin system RelE/ParE family toxin n=1 Tax=Vibrio sp. DW001 TaxID=2912315 RepID=UPI0023AEC5AB|nr:type II toxin-antitoxin system RelE/ParE family toxin [Vibrio sp. DW001]WED26892.1 type II toxin-antitoxin system RelE/ParE family toxin [Vibrio sp. DW001]